VSQRGSGYQRKERDAYETPEWVTRALLTHLPAVKKVWEPAAGSGQMVAVLRKRAIEVVASDLADGIDFLGECDPRGADAIVTNPPYALAQEFIEHGLVLMQPVGGVVAMLLRTDYDHAKTRMHLFHGSPAFAKKLVLTKRVVWFAGPNAAPSFNHAWYIWNWRHNGPPTIAYDVS
jgi:methylase of polypeptide subunit release factors